MCPKWQRLRTQVFHVNHALIPETCRIDGGILGVADMCAVTGLCDSQAVDGETG